MAGHQVVENLLIANGQVLSVGCTANNLTHVIQLINEAEFAFIDNDGFNELSKYASSQGISSI